MAGSLGFNRQYCIPTSKAPAGRYFAIISVRGAKIPVSLAEMTKARARAV